MNSAAPSRRVVAFGEIMLRLKAPGHERLLQGGMLETSFGGAEYNVAASLALFGHRASFVSALPPNALGEAALGEMRRMGVDVRHVRRSGERLGTYYLEAGTGARPSSVIYDRASSAFATLRPVDVDWDAALEGADWFHVSGVTPAVSATAAEATLQGVKAAQARGIPISVDLNYRANLWKYGKSAREVMPEIVRHAQLLLGGRSDAEAALGIAVNAASAASAASAPDGAPDGAPIAEHLLEFARKVREAFPGLRRHVMTLRQGPAADQSRWGACLYDGATMHRSRDHELTGIVDRIGAGDALAAGLIHGLLTTGDDTRALEFGVAAGCLKHTIPGDVNRVSVHEVERLVAGEGGGRVQR